MLRLIFLVVALFPALTFLNPVPPAFAAPEAQTVTVFAAASTTDVVTEIGRLFENQKMGTVTTSFASSSTLAKQIEYGAPADIFISADQKWMDYLDTKKRIDPTTRVDLLGNQIVLITPAGSPLTSVALVPGVDLAGLLKQDHLAMGDPGHVPAGRYGRAALEYLGAWQGIETAIAGAASVRAALALVERGEAPLGVVYATDAAISSKVKIVGRFPPESHPPITYPVAIVSGRATEAAKRFIAFLKSDQARALFERAGFVVH